MVDFIFTLFYFRFLRESSFRNLLYWSKLQRTPRFYAWAGISFEILAMNHISQVKQRLGIAGVSTNLYSWRSKSSGEAEHHLIATIATLLPRFPMLWLLMEKNTKNKKKKQKNEIKVACYPIFLLTLQKQEKVLPIP